MARSGCVRRIALALWSARRSCSPASSARRCWSQVTSAYGAGTFSPDASAALTSRAWRHCPRYSNPGQVHVTSASATTISYSTTLVRRARDPETLSTATLTALSPVVPARARTPRHRSALREAGRACAGSTWWRARNSSDASFTRRANQVVIGKPPGARPGPRRVNAARAAVRRARLRQDLPRWPRLPRSR